MCSFKCSSKGKQAIHGKRVSREERSTYMDKVADLLAVVQDVFPLLPNTNLSQPKL